MAGSQATTVGANPLATADANLNAYGSAQAVSAGPLAAVTPKPSQTTGYTYETFPWQQYTNYADSSLGTKIKQGNNLGEEERKRAWADYQARGSSWTQPGTQAAPSSPGASTVANANQVVAGNPQNTNQINVATAAGQTTLNPSNIVNNTAGTQLTGNSAVGTVDPNAAGTTVNASDPRYAISTAAAPGTATVKNTAQAQAPTQGATNTYQADTTFDKVAGQDMTAAKGTMNPNAQIDAAKLQIDTNAIATGKNPDGSVNQVGAAINQAAQQNIVNVIDTSTMAGKLLADKLGEGNYTDAKATLKGQLDILSAEFANEDGSAKIPSWAQGAARSVSKIATFTGMTGTAATAAMATAIMEASIPVAQQDAQFFQTLTVQNLNNRQQQTINKANILANLETANLDARTTAAVENAKNFMQLDLANLSNEQQSRVINTQSRVQSILEDSKAVNAQRLFTAQSQNDMDMFYDNLSASVSQFNANQTNQVAMFNAGEVNSMAKFNAELENQKQEFYKNMQYNIDTSNAKWRQTVTLTNSQQKFEAAATDVQNKLNISQEAMNQLWDRSDALLDYTWKSAENEKERANNLLISQMQIQSQQAINKANNKAASNAAIGSGVGSVLGTVLGAYAGSTSGSTAISKLFGGS